MEVLTRDDMDRFKQLVKALRAVGDAPGDHQGYDLVVDVVEPQRSRLTEDVLTPVVRRLPSGGLLGSGPTSDGGRTVGVPLGEQETSWTGRDRQEKRVQP